MVQKHVLLFTSLLSAFLCAFVADAMCTVVKDANYYLQLPVPPFLAESTGGSRIGDCYIVPKARSGSCDMYAKSGVRGADGDRGWPKTSSNRGTGCVRAPRLPRRVTTCYYSSSSYRLSPDLIQSFCTDDGSANAVAMIKHAIRNGACNIPNPQPHVPCGNTHTSPPTEQCSVANKRFAFRSLVTLDRARRCRNRRFFCNSVTVRPEYGAFRGISKRRQRKLFLTQYSNPPRSGTENIVLIVAGQQFSKGLVSGLTGQDRDYKKGFSNRKTGSLVKTISSNSLLKRIFDTNYFSPADTFVGLVFDARFNFEYSKRNKNRQENAYYSYILGKLGPKKRTIYLAGHSRGGCLVMRLAARITAAYPNVRVVVHNYDGVCANGANLRSSEFGVGKPTRRNPLRKDDRKGSFVYTTSMTDRFRARNCVAVKAYLSGALFAELPLKFGKNVRAFGHRGFAFGTTRNSLRSGSGFAWYDEQFVREGHNSIAQNAFLHVQSAQHLKNAMEKLPCSCGM